VLQVGRDGARWQAESETNTCTDTRPNLAQPTPWIPSRADRGTPEGVPRSWDKLWFLQVRTPLTVLL
jgi:hypothetical protein